MELYWFEESSIISYSTLAVNNFRQLVIIETINLRNNIVLE